MGASPSTLFYDNNKNVAAKLSSPQPCILAFLSPQCGLCRALRPALSEVSLRSSRHLPPPPPASASQPTFESFRAGSQQQGRRQLWIAGGCS